MRFGFIGYFIKTYGEFEFISFVEILVSYRYIIHLQNLLVSKGDKTSEKRIKKLVIREEPDA
jgi:hypothetical protein